MTAHSMRGAEPIDEPAFALAAHIGKTVRFVRSAPFMHRLMIDEMVRPARRRRARVRDMNLDLVQHCRDLLDADGGREFVGVDPLLLHLAVLGASDFFSSAEPIIRELLPDGKDVEKLTADFQSFLIDLLMNGLRRR